jgi:hypothetical protein
LKLFSRLGQIAVGVDMETCAQSQDTVVGLVLRGHGQLQIPLHLTGRACYVHTLIRTDSGTHD